MNVESRAKREKKEKKRKEIEKKMNSLFRKLKQSVSRDKQRYVDDRYNLDLTYITERIIGKFQPKSFAVLSSFIFSLCYFYLYIWFHIRCLFLQYDIVIGNKKKGTNTNTPTKIRQKIFTEKKKKKKKKKKRIRESQKSFNNSSLLFLTKIYSLSISHTHTQNYKIFEKQNSSNGVSSGCEFCWINLSK